MEQEDMHGSFNIFEIFQIIRRRIVLISVITVVCGLGSFLVSSYILKPVYQANISIIVGLTNTNQIDPNQVNTYQSILNTFAKIALTQDVADSAANMLNDGTSALELKETTSVKQVADTQILTLSSTNADPHKAYSHAVFMASAFITQSSKLFTTGKAQIMERAIIPSSPIKPDKKINTLAAAIFGLMFSISLSLILNYLDRTIKSEKDIEKYIGIPVIGIIPKLSDEEPDESCNVNELKKLQIKWIK